jgi:hypothetical protein
MGFFFRQIDGIQILVQYGRPYGKKIWLSQAISPGGTALWGSYFENFT